MAQVPGEQRRRGRAVDVVIAEDRDLLAARRCNRDALCGRFHLRHGVGNPASICEWSGRENPRPRRSRRHAPQHPRQHFRQLIALRDRQRPPPRRAHRAGRATVFRSRNAIREKRRRASMGNADAGSVMIPQQIGQIAPGSMIRARRSRLIPSSSQHRGMLCRPLARNDVKACLRDLAAWFARGLACSFRPPRQRRRECRASDVPIAARAM